MVSAKYILSAINLLGLTLASPIPEPAEINKRDIGDYWLPGDLRLGASATPFVTFDNGVYFGLALNGRLEGFDADDNMILYTDGPTADCASYACSIEFQTNGDLVITWNDEPIWHTGTDGVGYKYVLQETSPYQLIYDSDGNVVYGPV
jgi:hypothetical protein